MSRYRPKECIKELESKYTLVDLLYNEKLNEQWIVTCKGDNSNMTVKGNSMQEVLNDAVSRSRV